MVKNVKMEKVAKDVLENGGSIAPAMRKAGYSEAYSKNPHKITSSKSWQELMEQYLPDDLLASKHQELIMKTDEHGEMDTQATKSGLDMAYKLKGKYAPEKHEHTVETIEVVKYDQQD